MYTLLGQIRKSADKVLVGKAIWKLMCMPAILFGRAIIPTSEGKIEGLQRLENRVWRFLLGVGGYSTVEALTREMGGINGELQNNGDNVVVCHRLNAGYLQKH